MDEFALGPGMPGPTQFAIWTACLVHTALALVLVYSTCRATIRIFRSTLDIERWRAGYARGRVMGHTFRYDPDVGAIAALYVALVLWDWLSLPAWF